MEDLGDGSGLGFVFFWGHQPPKGGGVGPSCLSQWWPSPFSVEGIAYPTAEHFMMAAKARLFADAGVESRVLAAPTPKAAKALGREVRPFDSARWEQARFARCSSRPVPSTRSGASGSPRTILARAGRASGGG